MVAAWKFLLPIGTGSRYINEFHGTPEEGELFPVGPHISKVINCFKEATPKETEEDYSYLSEFFHPNMMTFSQHYRWTTPYAIDFVDQVEFGAFGAIAGSTTQGLMEIRELLNLGSERHLVPNLWQQRRRRPLHHSVVHRRPQVRNTWPLRHANPCSSRTRRRRRIVSVSEASAPQAAEASHFFDFLFATCPRISPAAASSTPEQHHLSQRR